MIFSSERLCPFLPLCAWSPSILNRLESSKFQASQKTLGLSLGVLLLLGSGFPHL
jgi:hypothetical protein